MQLPLLLAIVLFFPLLGGGLNKNMSELTENNENIHNEKKIFIVLCF
jgi:hypothetical protein